MTYINSKNVRKYLKTLSRIPKENMLALATDCFYMGNENTCLCGNAIREDLMKLLGIEFSDDMSDYKLGEYCENNLCDDNYNRSLQSPIPMACSKLFGGTYKEWEEIFYGVIGDNYPNLENTPLEIETAFITRLNQCVN